VSDATLTFWEDDKETAPPRGARLTFLDYAGKVLRRARRALTPAEIWNHPEGAPWRAALRTTGQGQVHTLASALYGDVQRPSSRFVRIGGMPARFGLRRGAPAAGKRPRPGILFALETPAMPGLLHLALCAPDEVPAVLRTLRGPASPLPFSCPAAWRVEDRRAALPALDAAFSRFRLHSDKAFYLLSPGRLRAWAAENLPSRDATADVQRTLARETSAREKKALRRFRDLSSRPLRAPTLLLPLD
jgi:hypothetical protein